MDDEQALELENSVLDRCISCGGVVHIYVDRKSTFVSSLPPSPPLSFPPSLPLSLSLPLPLSPPPLPLPPSLSLPLPSLSLSPFPSPPPLSLSLPPSLSPPLPSPPPPLPSPPLPSPPLPSPPLPSPPLPSLPSPPLPSPPLPSPPLPSPLSLSLTFTLYRVCRAVCISKWTLSKQPLGLTSLCTGGGIKVRVCVCVYVCMQEID